MPVTHAPGRQRQPEEARDSTPFVPQPFPQMIEIMHATGDANPERLRKSQRLVLRLVEFADETVDLLREKLQELRKEHWWFLGLGPEWFNDLSKNVKEARAPIRPRVDFAAAAPCSRAPTAGSPEPHPEPS